MKIAVTGASGFIGTYLTVYLASQSHKVQKFSRVASHNFIKLPDVIDSESWGKILEGTNVFVHLAGRAHILNDNAEFPLEEFRKINVDWTLEVAKRVISSDVKRFIYFSSLGVYGSETSDVPFSESSEYRPRFDYALSKVEAEKELKKLFASSNKDLVIIRPPLVYAYDAPGNFARLLCLAKTRIPLPFGAVKNKRSLISVNNLINFTALCCEHPKAANEDFVVCDSEVITTADIISNLRIGMSNKIPVFNFPEKFLIYFFKLFRRFELFRKVFGSLEVSNQKAKSLLGWSPIESTQESLRIAGKQYIQKKRFVNE